MILYLDTAANANWEWKLDKAHPAQPRMIRLAWATEEPGSEQCILVHAGVKEISPETFARDGVSKADLDRLGAPLADALDQFGAVLAGVTTVIGFSWDFHKRVIDRSVGLLGRPAIDWLHRPANSPPEAGSIRHLRPVEAATPGRRHRAVRRG
jgi:hypothetical protein